MMMRRLRLQTRPMHASLRQHPTAQPLPGQRRTEARVAAHTPAPNKNQKQKIFAATICGS